MSDYTKDRLTVAGTVLLLLLTADAGYIVIHLVHAFTAYLPDRLYSIERDGGFAEWFEYAQELWAFVLALLVLRRTRQPIYAVWALLFLYFLSDDAFTVHEFGGESVARHLHLPGMAKLRSQDFGELVFIGFMGLGFFTSIAWCFRTAASNARRVSTDLTLLVMIFIIFAVAMDTLHSAIIGNEAAGPLGLTMGLVEDGGEMLTMSTICWYLLAVFDRDGVAPSPLPWDGLRLRFASGRTRVG